MTTNYSELNTLGMCERRWAFGYELHREEDGRKVGLHRGSLLHLGKGRWSQGLGATLPTVWEDDMGPGGRPGDTVEYRLDDYDPEVVDSATWLLNRYAEHYGPQPPSDWKLLATEPWLRGTIAGEPVVGRADNLWEIDGLIWLDETKSYGNKSRIDYLGVDPQLSIYYDLVKQTFDLDIFGIMWDGIYTHRYATQRPTQGELIARRVVREADYGPDEADQPAPFAEWTKKRQQDYAREALATGFFDQEQPTELSFHREWIDRTANQIEAQSHAVRAAVRRMDYLREMSQAGLDIIERSIPNIGQSCNSCGHKNRCWAQLLGEPEYVDFGQDPDAVE